ncbi:ATP-dependent Lon protease [Cereibacter sp. SYSU M97828]|nr:ATP-dependent Lon protease [Cereibacter flavus]
MTKLLSELMDLFEVTSKGPSPEELASAPLLQNWRPLLDMSGVVVLWGHVENHPLLGNDAITTSRLFRLDTEQGFARTWSRWYRLGTPFTDLEHDLLQSISPETGNRGTVMFELPGYQTVPKSENVQELLSDFKRRMQKLARQHQDRATD